MGLDESCKRYLGNVVLFKPEYGWGWTRADAPGVPVPAQVNGVPFPFHCRVDRLFYFHGELRGFIGHVEEPNHIYDGLQVVIYNRVIGTFNLTDALPYCNIHLGAHEPVGDFPAFVSGSPIVDG